MGVRDWEVPNSFMSVSQSASESVATCFFVVQDITKVIRFSCTLKTYVIEEVIKNTFIVIIGESDKPASVTACPS